MKYLGYELRHVRGHVEVYLNGVFQSSADTMAEAVHEICSGGDDE